MSKQHSVLTEHKVRCSGAYKLSDGHKDYAQSNKMDSKGDFIKAVEGLGWKWIKDDWHCPACAKESNK